MFYKQDFLELIESETVICKHIHSKMDVSNMEYRPAGNQRTTLELMQYLTICASGPTDALIKNDWSVIKEYREASHDVAFENFCERMNAQLQNVRERVGSLSDEDLQRETSTPFGTQPKLGRALVEMPLRFLAAYRLQLFVNAKACGVENMTTFNAWLGKDKED